MDPGAAKERDKLKLEWEEEDVRPTLRGVSEAIRLRIRELEQEPRDREMLDDALVWVREIMWELVSLTVLLIRKNADPAQVAWARRLVDTCRDAERTIEGLLGPGAGVELTKIDD